jgi:hypothetical protein
MTTSLKCKAISAITIYKIEVDAMTAYEKEAKVRTKKYHEQLMEIEKADRRGSLPPFLLVVEAVIDVSVEICFAKYARDAPVTLACIGYQQELAALDAPSKAQRVLMDWRYARFSSTWAKSRTMFEIGIAPVHSEAAATFLRAIIPIMTEQCNGHQKHGVAPKSKLELRIETVLQQLGVWSKR